MWFGVLGPLTVQDDDGQFAVTSRRERSILSTLLLAAGQPVGLSTLIDEVWPGSPPPTARKQVQNCVASVTRRLHESEGLRRVHLDGDGYRVDVSTDSLDSLAFEYAVRRGQEAERRGDMSAAVEHYRAGLHLWRGDVLAGAEGVHLRPSAVRLGELRWAVYEQCIGIELSSGALGSLRTAELRAAVGTNPGREKLVAYLMLALASNGRSLEALEVFQRARGRLIDDFGLEPGRDLREAQAAVLRGRFLPIGLETLRV